jgi:LDH2 family malate/lactate/ureidoglycolate dehydrogenase
MLRLTQSHTFIDNKDNIGLVAIDETRRFMFDCFLQSKTSKENAQAMADLLAEADYRG